MAEHALPFAFVDVFSATPLAGNPLAVVGDADDLSEETMRSLAREFNQSETTFVMSSQRPNVAARLRSFTAAGVEVGGAGHNALGAWWWLAQTDGLSLDAGAGNFVQEIAGRELEVEVTATEDGRPKAIAMTQEEPSWGQLAEDSPIAAALGLGDGDLGRTVPAQVVSTGAPHLLIEARDRSAVDRAEPETAVLAELLRTVEGEGCYLFSLDPLSPAASAYARFFNPTVGLSEDPATGTAAGPLACHLVRHGVLPEPAATAIIEQGHAMGRPSQIEISVEGSRVVIHAECVIAAEGTLRL